MTAMPGEFKEFEIRPMKRFEISEVAITMAKAFMRDELYVRLVPSEEARMEFLKRFMTFRLTFGIEKGFVEVTDDLKGVAVWIIPGNRMEFTDLILSGGVAAMLSLPKESRRMMREFIKGEEMAKKSVVSQPYWYLSPVCVSPELQGKGIGKALIGSGLKRISASGYPCFLETQSQRTRDYYETLGFTMLSQQDIGLGASLSIPHFTMLFKGSQKEFTEAEKRRWLRPNRNKWAEGIGGVVIGGGLMVFSMSALDGLNIPDERLSMIMVIGLLVLAAFASIKAYRKGYPEFALGIGALFIAPILAVVLLFGTCMLMLS